MYYTGHSAEDSTPALPSRWGAVLLLGLWHSVGSEGVRLGAEERCAWFGQLFPSWSPPLPCLVLPTPPCLDGACVLWATKPFSSLGFNQLQHQYLLRHHKGTAAESNLISLPCGGNTFIQEPALSSKLLSQLPVLSSRIMATAALLLSN